MRSNDNQAHEWSVLQVPTPLMHMLYVGIGGFIGANARYLVSLGSTTLFGSDGRYLGTFTVNFVGSILLAAFMSWVNRQTALPDAVSLIIATGFFGAYTTFSTFTNETMMLWRDGRIVPALIYWALSNALALIGVLIGLWWGTYGTN
jgi:CrcB protein